MEMLCGERLTAGRAFEVGLVSRVFEGPRFEEEVTAGAEALARRGGAALRGIVELWRAPGAAEEHRALERRLFAECLSRRPTR
jgi:enoyl-CoA hydratase/carnithine racemase